MRPSGAVGTAQAFDTLFTPVTDYALAALQEALNASVSRDPYQRSAGYYAMTGRHGLWKVARNGTFILLCRHPNAPDEFLVFCPMGESARTLLSVTIATLKKMNVPVRFCRVEENSALAHGLQSVPEDVLDWKYPVHTLDTQDVAAHAGKGFSHFRQKLNALDPTRASARDIDPASDSDTIIRMVAAWADNDAEKIAPYQRLMDLFAKLPMAGRVSFYDGRLCGLAVWEETAPSSNLANAYAHLTLHAVKGLSQYMFQDMCRTLAHKGFSRLCIGGSETEGLERFKRNLCPVDSVALTSWVPQDEHAERIHKAA